MIHAFDKITGRYVPVSKGKKGVKYNSDCCDGDIIFCKGEKVTPYFRHYDEKTTCNGVGNNGESRMHKEAKNIIAEILNNTKTLTFQKRCDSCFEYSTHDITITREICVQEHRFNFNDKLKIADLACIFENTCCFIIEIKHTHGTNEEDRPDAWCEFMAEKVVLGNEFICVRSYICEDCQLEEQRLARDEKQRLELEQIRFNMAMQRRIIEGEKKKLEEEQKRIEDEKRKVEEEERKKVYEEEQEAKIKKIKEENLLRQKEWNIINEKLLIEKKLKEEEKNKKLKSQAVLCAYIIKRNKEKQKQLKKDIIKLWGEHNAYMIEYITPKDVIYQKNILKRISLLDCGNNY